MNGKVDIEKVKGEFACWLELTDLHQRLKLIELLLSQLKESIVFFIHGSWLTVVEEIPLFFELTNSESKIICLKTKKFH